MSEVMMVLSQAISKGAKPLFTEEGQKMIADYLNNPPKEQKEGVA